MQRVEFSFDPGKVPLSRKLRCRALNALDARGELFGGGLSFPGEEFDARQACLQFVRFKDILDLTLDASESAYRSTYKFTEPDGYVEHMLPGIRFSFDGKRVAEEVDPEMVIGCSWQQHEPPADPWSVMDKLNRPKSENMNRADYCRVGDLPLFVAGEGKNRVELFRRHGRRIAADVQRQTPEALPVLCRDLSGKRWLAAWMAKDGARMLATVPFPSVAFPIYCLLGAEIQSERLPVEEGEAERSLLATIHHLTEAVAYP